MEEVPAKIGGRLIPQRGELWRHYKGRLYEIVAMARYEATTGPGVVYRAYEPNGQVWVRPLHDFMGEVPAADAVEVATFNLDPEVYGEDKTYRFRKVEKV